MLRCSTLIMATVSGFLLAGKNHHHRDQLFVCISNTVEPLYNRHQGDRSKCPYYRGVFWRTTCTGFIWILFSQGPNELSIIERCLYYGGAR